MCGRYVSPKQQDVERLFEVRGTPGLFVTCYNVAPTMPVPMVHVDRRAGERTLSLARWGLLPGWWNGAKPPTHTFNARLEDAAEKPMWRRSFRFARCVVPAAGWYEWQPRNHVDPLTGEIRGYRQPWFLHSDDSGALAFAGLMAWTKPQSSNDWLASCAILTTRATGVAADIHHRMPAILGAHAVERWLDPSLVEPRDIAALLEADADRDAGVVMHAVSTRVNGSKNDDPRLIEPIALSVSFAR